MSLENWVLVIATLVAPILAVVVAHCVQRSRRSASTMSMTLQIRVRRR